MKKAVSFNRLGQWGITNDERQGDKSTTPNTPTRQINPVTPVETPGIKGLKPSVNPHDVGQKQGSKKVKPHNPAENPAHHKDPRPYVSPLMHSEAVSFNKGGQWKVEKIEKPKRRTSEEKAAQEKHMRQQYAIGRSYKDRNAKAAGALRTYVDTPKPTESIKDMGAKIIQQAKSPQLDLPLTPKKSS